MQSSWNCISWTFHFQSANLNDWMCLAKSSMVAVTEGLHKKGYYLAPPEERNKRKNNSFARSCSGNKWEGRCHLHSAARPSPSEPLFVPNADTQHAGGHDPAVDAKFPLPPKRRKPFARCKLPGAFAIAAWSHWRMRMEVADDLSMGLALRRIRILELLYCLRDQPDVSTCPSYHVGVSGWFPASIKQSSISISMDGCIWGLIP